MTYAQALAIGTELADEYRIERVLGAGGFGITYLAEDVPLARSVTLKEYFPADFAVRVEDSSAVPRSEASRPDFTWGLDRFVDEAQALAKFDHPNIVKVYRYFRANGTAYMALKWEEGQSLKTWLAELGRTPRQAEIDAVLGPLLDALEVVHAEDFLHRDIAPDNIIVRTDGSPVLIDFGSARGDLAQRSRTVSALVKPGYSPYEQYAEDSARQGAWTDVYALGATLYHLVSGKRPADAPSRVVHDSLKPARDVALGSFRPKFLAAIDRAMALDIKKRPKSVAEWRKDLFQPETKRNLWGATVLGGAGEGPATQAGDRHADGQSELSQVGPAPEAAPVGHPVSPDTAKHAPTVPVSKTPLPATPRRPVPNAERGPGLMSRLKRGRNSPAPAEAKVAATPEHISAEAAVAGEPRSEQQQESGSRRFGIGWGPGRRKAPARNRKAVLPDLAAKAFAAPRPPGTPAGRAIQAIAAIEGPVAKRKPPRLRRKPLVNWRSLGIKLALGGLVAGGAVALQKSLPQVVEERTSLTTSSIETPASFLKKQFIAHDGGVGAVSFANSGRWIVTTGLDETLKIWDASSNDLVRTINLSHGPATAFTVHGDRAITGHDEGNLSIWDLNTGQRVTHLKRNDARIWDVAVTSGDGNRVAVASHDWAVTLWDLNQTAAPLHIFEGHANAVQSLASDPGRALLFSGSADKSLRVWNLSTLSLRSARGRAHDDFVTALSPRPDRDRFASGDLSGTIRIWSGDARRRLRRLSEHNGAVTGLAFLPDGERLASASKDGRLILWDIDRGRTLKTFGSRGIEVNGLAIAPDGRSIATAGADGIVRIWDINT